MRGEKGRRRLEIGEERGGRGKERRGREWMGVRMSLDQEARRREWKEENKEE